MTFVIIGAHCTGKTTLAKAVAEETGMAFVETSTSAVFKKHGIDPAKELDFQERLFIQNLILTEACNIWEAAKPPFITDRSPVDMLAYTLADVPNFGTGDAGITQLVETYTEACFEAARKYFKTFILLQPGIPLQEDPTGKLRAGLNPLYIEKLNALISGLAKSDNLLNNDDGIGVVTIRRTTIDLQDRIDAVKRIVISKSLNFGEPDEAFHIH